MLEKIPKYFRICLLKMKYAKSFSIPMKIREWEKNIRVNIVPTGHIQIGKCPWIRQNVELWCEKNAVLDIGEYVFINSGCIISSRKRISIGNRTIIGPHVMIYDHNHAHHFSDKAFDEGEVVIGENVWIGANACILKDVTIGDNCIIGAGTVLTKDVPSNTIVYSKQNLEFREI